MDSYGNPIFLSLLRSGGQYSGHYVGTMQTLAKSIREHFPRNAREINSNLHHLQNKYARKAADRVHAHIGSEQDYLLSLCNDMEKATPMEALLKDFRVLESCEMPETEAEPEAEKNEADKAKEERPVFRLNPKEEEITIGLLLDTIDSMQKYIDVLEAEVERAHTQDRAHIKELEAQNEEYKAAMVRMRTFLNEQAEDAKETAVSGYAGHDLLGKNGKLLVFGATALDVKDMNGIAKTFGFRKGDLEYETDYSKVVNYAGRLNNGKKYAAIIFGACPHKVAGLGDWSSIAEKFSQCAELPYTIEARTRSGELKVTKESFKLALAQICEALRLEQAS